MDSGKTTAVKLPEAELAVMLAVWRCAPPVTTARLMLLTEPERGWKTSTVISFLDRLRSRGFLTAQKQGREYVWQPLVSRDEYVCGMTRDFFDKVHGGSVESLMNALYPEGLTGPAADALLRWLDKQG